MQSLTKKQIDRLNLLPEGAVEVIFDGARYNVSKHTGNDGKRVSLQATRLNDNNLISFNWYPQVAGGMLKPCEISEKLIEDFLDNYQFIA